MRNLIRTPLTWLVIAEFLVVGVLIVLAWQLVADAVRPAAAASSTAPVVDASSAADSPLPDVPATGLNLDSAFWRARLAQLNQDQVFFERLERQVVHTAIASMERYIQVVVVPAIERAEPAV